MDSCAVTAISICSGVGGLELGVRLVLPGLRVIAYGERDIAAATVLAARMADGQIDAAPIWSDVTTFDGARWAGSVDIVMGGVPCQPFSVAGKRRGQEDERWIWPDIWRWVREVRPRFVYLENVPGFVRHGLPVVLKDLAEAGFAAEWDCFSAAQLGAPHKRERVFVLAYTEGDLRGASGNDRYGASDGPGNCARGMADTGGERQQERCAAVAVRSQHAATECGGGDVADAGDRFVPIAGRGAEGRNGTGPAGAILGNTAQFAEREPGDAGIRDEHRHSSCGGIGGTGRLFPPGPDDTAGWIDYLAGSPEAEPAVRFPTHGNTGRLDELFLLGNGVVPIVAAKAFLVLAKRLGMEVTL